MDRQTEQDPPPHVDRAAKVYKGSDIPLHEMNTNHNFGPNWNDTCTCTVWTMRGFLKFMLITLDVHFIFIYLSERTCYDTCTIHMYKCGFSPTVFQLLLVRGVVQRKPCYL